MGCALGVRCPSDLFPLLLPTTSEILKKKRLRSFFPLCCLEPRWAGGRGSIERTDATRAELRASQGFYKVPPIAIASHIRSLPITFGSSLGQNTLAPSVFASPSPPVTLSSCQGHLSWVVCSHTPSQEGLGVRREPFREEDGKGTQGCLKGSFLGIVLGGETPLFGRKEGKYTHTIHLISSGITPGIEAS